jgi:hypothetical protein
LPSEDGGKATEASPGISLSTPFDSNATTGDGSVNPWMLFDFDNPFLGPPPSPPVSSHQSITPQLPLPEVITSSEIEKFTEYTTPDDFDPTLNQQALVVQDVTPIRDRWLYPVISAQATTCKPDESTVQFYGQILKTYPQMMLCRDHLPPIIHPWQLSATGTMPAPLANCFSLVRMWEARSNGAEQLVDETLGREMNRLFDEYRTYTELDLLATLQALLLYAIMSLFSSKHTSTGYPGSSTGPLPLITSSTITSIQQVAYRLATTGTALLLPCETPISHPSHSRSLPTWEDWITVSAKRRTVLALYCLDCVFNCTHNLPTFPCDELKFMPAPAGKVLWSAREREGWERAYCAWMARWSDGPSGGFMMGELMRRKEKNSSAEERLQRWLSEVDEFGMMMMVVVNGAYK